MSAIHNNRSESGKASPSAQKRSQGNDKLKTSQAIGLARSVRKFRVEEALQLYNAALSLASTAEDKALCNVALSLVSAAEDKASAHKNTAVAHRELCHYFVQDLTHNDVPPSSSSRKFFKTNPGTKQLAAIPIPASVKHARDKIVFHVIAAMESTALAMQECNAMLPSSGEPNANGVSWHDWKLNLGAKTVVFWSDLAQALQSTTRDDFASVAYRIAFDPKCVHAGWVFPDARASICHDLARYHHNQAVKDLEGNKQSDTITDDTSMWRKELVDRALGHAAETTRPVEEGRTLCQQAFLFNAERSCQLAKQGAAAKDFFVTLCNGDDEEGHDDDDDDDDCKLLHPALEFCANARGEFGVLLSDINFLNARIESHKALLQGDTFLEQCTEEEGMNMELFWKAVDCFRHSVVKARELDIETEAIAHSRLGRCYSKYLNLPLSRGKDSYRHAVELGLSMAPRILDDEPWFVEAKQAVEDYQRRVQINDDRRKAEEEAPYLEKLKDTISKIKENDTAEEALVYIYKNHPPKTRKNAKLNTEEATKANLKDALVHYHPDRNSKHGKEWQVLCSEICKYLTHFYNSHK